MKMFAAGNKFRVNMMAPFVKLFMLLALSLGVMHNAYALKCVNAADQSVHLYENIGSVAVPRTAPDGALIWRSENRTMNVTCWKDHGGTSEYPYAYFNPLRATLGTGISVGMVLNGTDIPNVMTAYRTGLPSAIIPTCDNTEAVCKKQAVTFTISYYVYIKKLGNPTGANYTGPTSLIFFQLDGEGGLNNTPDSNFQYVTVNMQGIRFLDCMATLSVSPSQIDFGGLVAGKAGYTIAASKNFTVNVAKSCNSPFKLTATYSSSSPKVDDNTLKIVNGVGLKFKNLSTGKYIQYSNVENFADMTTAYNVAVPFTAELWWLNTSPTLGAFNSALTITTYYN